MTENADYFGNAEPELNDYPAPELESRAADSTDPEFATEPVFYHAPIHHRPLTETPTKYAVVLEDKPEGTWAPHRLPPHPDPAHQRPVHVSSLAQARHLAETGPVVLADSAMDQTPVESAATQVISPMVTSGPLESQIPHVDYRGQQVVTYQPQTNTAPVVDPYLRPGQPAVPLKPARPKRHSHFGVALLSALLAAILASVGTLAWLSYHPGMLNAAPGQPAAVLPPAGSTPAPPGPVEGSTATIPYWQGVAAAVSDSVVAIQAAAPGGGSVGSGFVIDDAGHVLTNNHVIAGAANNQVQISLADGRLYHADIVGGDTFTDLAVVKLQNPPADLRPVSFGDSDGLYVGDPVLAIGNPLGLANTTTTGIISAINRPVTATGQDGALETVTNAIQIDAAINPGNSGGPLFDHQGRVIGVTSSIASLSSGIFGTSAGSIGLGFAIPINLARHISTQIIEHGEAQHPRLGVRLTSTTATAQGVSRRGARIESVDEGTAAAEAGMQAGDVVVGFNGLPVAGSDSLTGYVRERHVGDVVELTIIRNGQMMTLTATLGAMGDVPAAEVPAPELTIPPLENGLPENDTPEGGAPGDDGETWLDEYGYEYERD